MLSALGISFAVTIGVLTGVSVFTATVFFGSALIGWFVERKRKR